MQSDAGWRSRLPSRNHNPGLRHRCASAVSAFSAVAAAFSTAFSAFSAAFSAAALHAAVYPTASYSAAV